jgi:hypothetical protein
VTIDWTALDRIPNGHTWAAGFVAFLLLCFVLAAFLGGASRKAGAELNGLPPVNTRGYRPRGPVFIPFEVGNVTIDLQPTLTETIHVLVGGTSRTGKSTSVLPLFDLPIGVLCIALDVTPIEEKCRQVGGKVWTNDPAECAFGLNLLGGASMFASEGLVAGFPKSEGNIGDWQRSAREVIWDGMDAMDKMGIERSLSAVGAVLMQATGDAEVGRICRSWARKLGNLDRIIGPTLGYDLDLVDAMRRGEKVVCRLNRFLSPDDAPFLAGLLLVHARRVMQEAGVPFILIIEEAGQAALAQGHLSPIAQAGAARGVPAVVVTQNMSKLPVEVRNNFHVTASFAQEDKHERDVAADRLELHPDQLRRSAFPDKGVGWCYVRAPGVPTTLVHVKAQRPAKRAPAINLNLSVGTPPTGPRRSVIVREMGGLHLVRPALPAPKREAVPLGLQTSDGLRIWGRLKRTGRRCPLWHPTRGLWWDEQGCLVWTGGTNGKRPKSSIGPRSVTVYKWVYEQVVGPVPAGLTLDHLCGNVLCADWTHLEPCTLEENNHREPFRKAAFAAALAAV